MKQEKNKDKKTESKLIKNLGLLSESAFRLVELSPDEDIYEIIAENLLKLEENCYVLVNSYNKDSNTIKARSLAGFGKLMQRIIDALNGNPIGMQFPVTEEYAKTELSKGKFVKVPGKLHMLSFGTIPKPICSMLEKLLKIREIYSMGFSRKGEIYGTAVIIPTERNGLNNREMLETFVNEASIALQRKHSENALKESEERYRLLAENVSDVIWTSDLGLNMTYVSPSVEQLTGYTSEETMNLNLQEMLTPESAMQAGRILEEELVKENEKNQELHRSRILDLELKCKNGSTVCVEVKASFLRNKNHEAVGILGVTRDIEERKRLEDELLRSQKLESLGTLSAGIAHDFNNILTCILGNISFAKMHTNNDEKLQTILIAAEKASLRAKSLTSQILAFSKSVESMKEESSIVQLLDEFLGFSLQGSNASYEISKPDNPWNCMINKDKIGQAISNIIINAKESMPDGGKITVKVDNATLESNNDISLKKGEYVKITIQDRGIGIAEENLAKVFDPFFSTKSLGSGLGLSVSYSIVNDHNGYMSVESDLGKGTTVCVYLPAVSKQISSRKQKSNVSHSGKKRILVMDDEEMIRDFLAKALRHIGYDIELCQNGEEAIQIYRKAIHENNPFDAVIIDLTIRDGMGGKEAMQKLLEMDPDVKAIVTSGYSSEPILSYYHEYGFMGALPKPFRIKELTELLNKILLKNHQ